MIQQFTYTASPWGKSGAGWMVFQQSRDISPDIVKTLYDIYRYEEPKNVAEGTPFPVQFAYFPMDSGGGAVLAQTTFTGMRWWGEPRPGDFFSHVLLLDKDGVEASAKAGFNPVRLFMSPNLQSAFPKELTGTALDIYSKKKAWEPPPELGELQTLADLGENSQLAFDAALKAIPEYAIPQLGALVRAIIRRATGQSENPIVFDSGNRLSPSVMALALDLIPPSWRAQTWFAVHFSEHALRRIPVSSSLTFYGTDTKEASSDLGIVSGVDVSQDPFGFCNSHDVRSFKEQLDLLGAEVSLDDYWELVSFNTVSLGKTADLGAFRLAVKFAERFPKLMNKLLNGLAGAFAAYEFDRFPQEYHILAVVAWFEYHMDVFDELASQECQKCVQDFELLGQALQALGDDKARTAFLAAVSQEAENKGAAAFVNRVLETDIPLTDYVHLLQEQENSLLRLALVYRAFSGKHDATFSDESLNEASRIVESLYKKTGSGVKGLEEAKKVLAEKKKLLDYRQGLKSLREIEDIKRLRNKFVLVGLPKGVDFRQDVLDNYPAISIHQFVELGLALEEMKLKGVEAICQKWGKDQQEKQLLQQKNVELESKIKNLESSKAKPHDSHGCLFAFLACALGIMMAFLTGVWIAKSIYVKTQPSRPEQRNVKRNTPGAMKPQVEQRKVADTSKNGKQLSPLQKGRDIRQAKREAQTSDSENPRPSRKLEAIRAKADENDMPNDGARQSKGQ